MEQPLMVISAVAIVVALGLGYGIGRYQGAQENSATFVITPFGGGLAYTGFTRRGDTFSEVKTAACAPGERFFITSGPLSTHFECQSK